MSLRQKKHVYTYKMCTTQPIPIPIIHCIHFYIMITLLIICILLEINVVNLPSDYYHLSTFCVKII